MTVEHINPHVRFAMTFKYHIRNAAYVAYDAHMYYIISGKGSVLTNGVKKLRFEEGCVVIIPAGTPYLFSSDEEVKCVSVNFDYTKSNLKSEKPIFPAEEAEFDSEKICDRVFFDDYDVLNESAVFESCDFLKEKFEKMESELTAKRNLYKEIASAELKSIITELLRINNSSSATDRKIASIMNYIREHYNEEISNTSISEKFGYHPYHINRLMKASVGTTLHQYLIFYRIEMAKRFLCDTEHTVFEISKTCGYNNFSNFSADFKKKTGYTPLNYRERSKII
ncbi:MAG: helix-turn-helix domain-containing protein [Clostridia bacterium]|nr:helix-turn-helix domain-containing protein [Clostridia bacterium]